MRTKELITLLRTWESRERGETFKEIADVLEEQEKRIQELALYATALLAMQGDD